MQRKQRTVDLHHPKAARNKSFVSCMCIWGFLSYFASSLLYSFGSPSHQHRRLLTHNQYILHNTSLPRALSPSLAPSLFCFASRRCPGFLHGAFILRNQRRRQRSLKSKTCLLASGVSLEPTTATFQACGSVSDRHSLPLSSLSSPPVPFHSSCSSALIKSHK